MFKTSSLLAVTGVTAFVGAQTALAGQFAGQDFDGNTGVAGPATEVFSPDNSGNTGFGGAPGVFPSSNFDVFGITNRNVGFDFADDTLNGFAGDVIGFAGVGADDPGNFLGITDTVNGDNAVPVSATWTFDITGKTGLVVGIDITAYGDFETSDIALVQASIDGGSAVTIFDVGMTSTQDDADTLYQVTMDDGDMEDIYFSPFYSQSTWDNLINNGPSGSLDYHPDDTGLDGDTTAQDGFVPEPTFSNPTNETRGYTSGSFTNTQVEAYRDPLYEQVSGTQLDNQLQSFTTALAGTGSTLTLTLFANTNGNTEIIALDNIKICDEGDCGGATIPGDLDGDGIVGLADLALVLNNWDDQEPPPFNAEQDAADSNDDGIIGLADLALVLNNWDATAPAASVVPEPASLALFTMAGLAALSRRRFRS